MADYPYVLISSRDLANDAPISVKVQASSDTSVASEQDVIDLVCDFLEGLPGLGTVYATRYAVTETPA